MAVRYEGKLHKVMHDTRWSRNPLQPIEGHANTALLRSWHTPLEEAYKWMEEVRITEPQDRPKRRQAVSRRFTEQDISELEKVFEQTTDPSTLILNARKIPKKDSGWSRLILNGIPANECIQEKLRTDLPDISAWMHDLLCVSGRRSTKVSLLSGRITTLVQ